jgi:predicted RNA-binding protein with PIN domain
LDEYLLVDGYNIINSWPELKEIAQEDFESARFKLIDVLQDYQGYKGYRVILVFDAHLIKGGIERHDYYGNIEVVYTRENETADHYIERWVHEMGRARNIIRVATSDLIEQTIVMSRGAVRMSARELKLEIETAKKEQDSQYMNKIRVKNNRLEGLIKDDILKKLEKWRRER